ncbi:unnamed protein product [Caenorhabditis auriculariae]|uniref:Uncharacterized protein n=1 Tax=Caenorhabditis auriculariae TaxID=2777116 RepID=A0A8S1HUZ0_9PELO|nr:unnamed protein product [Caenorhabditis auriculariae]
MSLGTHGGQDGNGQGLEDDRLVIFLFGDRRHHRRLLPVHAPEYQKLQPKSTSQWVKPEGRSSCDFLFSPPKLSSPTFAGSRSTVLTGNRTR